MLLGRAASRCRRSTSADGGHGQSRCRRLSFVDGHSRCRWSSRGRVVVGDPPQDRQCKHEALVCAALAEESRRHVAAPELRRGRASRCLMCAHSRVCGFGRPANWAARDMMRYCVCCGGAGGRPDATPAQRILAFVASLLVCEAFCTMTSPVSISVAPGDALHNSIDAFLIAKHAATRHNSTRRSLRRFTRVRRLSGS